MVRAGIWSFPKTLAEETAQKFLPPAHHVRATRQTADKTSWLIEGPRMPEVLDFESAGEVTMVSKAVGAKVFLLWAHMQDSPWELSAIVDQTDFRQVLYSADYGKTIADCRCKFQNIRNFTIEEPEWSEPGIAPFLEMISPAKRG